MDQSLESNKGTAMNTSEIIPYVEILHGEIKTTSLKVSEHFGKRHDHVIRDIEKIIAQTANLPGAPKFGESSFEGEMPGGGKRTYKMYEFGKDAFILLAMGYTGEKAMAIKIAYINAFNAMAEQLANYQLPEPKTKKALPGGLTLEQQDTIKALVKQNAESLPQEQRAGAVIRQWSAIKKKFGCTYKEVSPDQFVNIISLLARLPLEGELLSDEKQKPALPAFTLDDIEAMIERKLSAAKPQATPHIDNVNYYSIQASRPGEFRWIYDVSIEAANRQLVRQGLQIVRI